MAKENLMITSLTIKNFRCFKELKLTDLRRFNVLVGQSGSGKTALLEALFLASAASPEIYLRLRGWRGLGDGIQFNGSKKAYESLFRELFYRFESDETAQIEFSDSDSGRRSLFIRYQSNDKYSMSLKSGSHAFSIDPILFRWKTGEKSFESVIELKDGKFAFSGSDNVYPVWFITPSVLDNYTDRFSELSKANKIQPVIKAVKSLFPEICDLSLESIVGQIVICASMQHLSEKIPAGMISGGFNKFLGILLAIASNAGGLVLIDEIENGLYFRSYLSMLKVVITFCEDNDVQLFITTHSEEFLVAMANAVEAKISNFSLIRSQRSDNETHLGITRGDLAVAAIAQDIEVR